MPFKQSIYHILEDDKKRGKTRRSGFSGLKSLLYLRRLKTSLLYHSKHIAHILDHDPGDVGDGIDVVICVVGEAGAGHEVQVLEDGVEAFADAVVEFAERGVTVDEQDGVAGSKLRHWDEAARRVVRRHKYELFKEL